MNINIISVSKTKLSYIHEAEAEYLKRFPKNFKVEITELNTSKIKNTNPEEVKIKEGEIFLEAVKNQPFFLLDETGKQFSSIEFSALINKDSNITLGIGGAFGFSAILKQKAKGLISFSKMTFPRQLCRLFLVEQIYRAYTIKNNIPYHKQ